MGCSPAPPNATAEGAARAFVELVVHFDGDPRQAEELFGMLSSRAQDNLQTRAKRYGAASGRTIEPAAMLVPARVALRFNPRSYDAQVVGSFAMVDVLGVRADQRAQIPCALEDGQWRVDVVLPELPPMLVGPGRDL
ncbi:MAG: hypothetical protein JRI23_17745 [Deltaproteobacteria bacterium]|nr:hypothetical protein [Deltaproteobacteria bacterium]